MEDNNFVCEIIGHVCYNQVCSVCVEYRDYCKENHLHNSESEDDEE